MKYVYWPFIKLDTGYSIPDKLLLDIWNDIVAEGRNKIAFYGGGIETFKDFIAYLTKPTNHFVFIADTEKKKIVFMAWMNNIQGKTAFVHFCGIGHGTYRHAIGRLVLDYWERMNIFDVVMATIPETNTTALKLIKPLGFVEIGTIPMLCHLHYENKTVGGVVSYYLMGGQNG